MRWLAKLLLIKGLFNILLEIYSAHQHCSHDGNDTRDQRFAGGIQGPERRSRQESRREGPQSEGWGGGSIRLFGPKRRRQDHHDERVAGVRECHRRVGVSFWCECSRTNRAPTYRLSPGADLLLQISNRGGAAALL